MDIMIVTILVKIAALVVGITMGLSIIVNGLRGYLIAARIFWAFAASVAAFMWAQGWLQ